MTDTHMHSPPAHSAIKVLAALAELGEATAAEVAERAGLGYSTTTPKLRAWEGTGQAERFPAGDGRTLWRLTDAGHAATATAGDPHPAGADALAPAAESSHLEAVEARRGAAGSAPTDDTGTPAGSGTPVDSGTAPREPEPDAPESGQPTGGDAGDRPRGGDRSPARRTGGSLRGAVLGILEAHPDRAYRTGELCKLIDAANAGSGAAKASAGAVANAAIKLVASGAAVQTVERPATYQLAPATVR
ncbi:MarR family transcriptional regulator [Micromonospora sp. NPDC050495]|uniref:MarR family transcriptional regulator n=1 Tax=Micromonospora sp. NPDC050495 TaxID=3154936 RepID=UPI0033C9A45F